MIQVVSSTPLSPKDKRYKHGLVFSRKYDFEIGDLHSIPHLQVLADHLGKLKRKVLKRIEALARI